MNTLIAILLFKLGVQYNCSSDIIGNITRGYGKLDWNGYWQYPLPSKYIIKPKAGGRN